MSVSKEIGKGTLYNAIAKYIGIAVNLIVTGVLARLLTPEEFGTVALTTIFVTFFDLLGNMGFGPAIIQNRQLSNKDLASIFNITVIIAVLLGIVCFLAAPFVASSYDNGILVPVMRVLSLQVLFTILGVVPYSLILKEKRFRFIAISNVSCQTSFGAVAIVCAICGMGIYSLLVAPICTAMTLFVIYTIKSRRDYGNYHSLIFKWESIDKVLSFSIYQFLFNIVNYFSRNLDKLLIGNRFTMSDLGYYEKSYRLMQLPISNISSVMTPTIQPVLSKFQDDKSLFKTYVLTILRLLAYIGFVITPLLFFSARDIIIIVFGDQWEPAIPIFSILALSVFAQIVDSSSGSFFQAGNSPKLLFVTGLLCAILNVLCITLGVYVFKSIIALAWLLNFAFILNLIIDLYFMIFKVTCGGWRDVFFVFMHPLMVGLIISLLLYTISFLDIDNVIVNFALNTVITVLISIWYAYTFNIINKRWLSHILRK